MRRDHSRELVSEQTVKSVDKLQNSGTIKKHPLKINIQLFARKPSDFPTVWLSNQEYAHVMSEIATNITEEQSSRTIFRKCIGNYIYTVENKGFGNYRIIGKEDIK